MVIPSSLDPTLAPPGHHICLLFTQFVPYSPVDGEWNEAKKEEYANVVFDSIERLFWNYQKPFCLIYYVKVCSWFQRKYCWQRSPPTTRAGEGIWPDRREHLPWLYVPGSALPCPAHRWLQPWSCHTCQGAAPVWVRCSSRGWCHGSSWKDCCQEGHRDDGSQMGI